jgi:hypothetical protein
LEESFLGEPGRTVATADHHDPQNEKGISPVIDELGVLDGARKRYFSGGGNRW